MESDRESDREKKDGRKERSCTVCGHKETAVINSEAKQKSRGKNQTKTASVKTGDKTDPAVYIFFCHFDRRDDRNLIGREQKEQKKIE